MVRGEGAEEHVRCLPALSLSPVPAHAAACSSASLAPLMRAAVLQMGHVAITSLPRALLEQAGQIQSISNTIITLDCIRTMFSGALMCYQLLSFPATPSSAPSPAPPACSLSPSLFLAAPSPAPPLPVPLSPRPLSPTPLSSHIAHVDGSWRIKSAIEVGRVALHVGCSADSQHAGEEWSSVQDRPSDSSDLYKNLIDRQERCRLSGRSMLVQ